MKPVLSFLLLLAIAYATIRVDSGFSTYIGWGDQGGIVLEQINQNGELVISGYTTYPTLECSNGAYQTTYMGNGDAFIMIYNPNNNQVKYLSYFGGSGNDGMWILGDDTIVYLVGNTSSRDLPVTEGCYQGAYGGGEWDCYVAKINITTNELIFGTYIGGSGYDMMWSRPYVNDSGQIYIAGITTSGDFPRTPGAAQRLYGGGEDDAFITKLSSDGKQLIYSTLLGGNGNDQALGLAVDSLGQAYVCGVTGSSNFPVRDGAFQDSLSTVYGNCFVTKLSADGKQFLESTYIGGKYASRADAILLDGDHGIYIIGQAGQEFPTTANAFRTTTASPITDGFIAKITPDLSTLIYCTYAGGSRRTELYEIIKDEAGNLYVSGGTYDPEYPISFHSKYKPESNHGNDMLVAVFDSTLSNMLFGGVIGGSEWDDATGMVLDNFGNLYVSGYSRSSDFPTTPGAFQESYGGGESDGVLVKIPASEIIVSTSPVPGVTSTLALGQAYPNPAISGNMLTIPYSVAQHGAGSISIYNTLGQQVATYPISHNTPGNYTKTIALPALQNGLYFYTLEYGGKRETRKMVVG